MNKIEQIIDKIESLDEKYRRIRIRGTNQQAKEADLVIKVLRELKGDIQDFMELAIDAEVCSHGVFFPLIVAEEKEEKYPELHFGDKVKMILIKN